MASPALRFSSFLRHAQLVSPAEWTVKFIGYAILIHGILGFIPHTVFWDQIEAELICFGIGRLDAKGEWEPLPRKERLPCIAAVMRRRASGQPH